MCVFLQVIIRFLIFKNFHGLFKLDPLLPFPLVSLDYNLRNIAPWNLCIKNSTMRVMPFPPSILNWFLSFSFIQLSLSLHLLLFQVCFKILASPPPPPSFPRFPVQCHRCQLSRWQLWISTHGLWVLPREFVSSCKRTWPSCPTESLRKPHCTSRSWGGGVSELETSCPCP